MVALIVIVSVPEGLVPAPFVAVTLKVQVPAVALLAPVDVTVTLPELSIANHPVQPEQLPAVQLVGVLEAVMVLTASLVLSGRLREAVPLLTTGADPVAPLTPKAIKAACEATMPQSRRTGARNRRLTDRRPSTS